MKDRRNSSPNRDNFMSPSEGWNDSHQLIFFIVREVSDPRRRQKGMMNTLDHICVQSLVSFPSFSPLLKSLQRRHIVNRVSHAYRLIVFENAEDTCLFSELGS
jgi:hypothetical protein